MSYGPDSEIQNLLPPDSVGTGAGQITTAQLATANTAGSALVDSDLAHLYWPFTAYVASPAQSPPWVVRQASWYYGAGHAYRFLQMANALDEGDPATQMFAQGKALLDPFISGRQIIPPENYSQSIESGDWGDGDPLNTNQAYLDKTSVEIVPESGQISGYEYGIDFQIYYLVKERKWVIERLDSTISVATLTYDFSYLRSVRS